MKKTRWTIGAVAFLALVAGIIWQQGRVQRLVAEAGRLRDEAGQVALWREENRRLTKQLQSASERSQAELSELLRLRGQSGRMRQIEQENNQLRAERDRRAKAESSLAEVQEEETPEVKLRKAKGLFGRDLGMALILAAGANGGNLPAELRGPLFDMLENLSAGAQYDLRARHFELVYTGSLRDVKEVSTTILAREKEPVQSADGQWVRLYVLADGSSQYISAPTPDGFTTREREFWPASSKP